MTNIHGELNMTASGLVLPAGFSPVGAANTVPVSNGAGGIVWQQIGNAQVASSAAIDLSKLAVDPRDAGHIVSSIKANFAVTTGGTTFGVDPTNSTNVSGFDSNYPPRDAASGTPQIRLLTVLRIAIWGTSTLANCIGSAVAGTVLGGAGIVTVLGPTTVSHAPADGTNIWMADSGWVDDSTSGRFYGAQIQINWLTARPTTGQGWAIVLHRIRP